MLSISDRRRFPLPSTISLTVDDFPYRRRFPLPSTIVVWASTISILTVDDFCGDRRFLVKPAKFPQPWKINFSWWPIILIKPAKSRTKGKSVWFPLSLSCNLRLRPGSNPLNWYNDSPYGTTCDIAALESYAYSDSVQVRRANEYSSSDGATRQIAALKS